MNEANNSLKLARHALGSIDFTDIEDKDLSEQERKDYCAAIHALLPRLEKDVTSFMYRQVIYMTKEAGNWEQVIFGRGGLDAMAMLLEHWRQAHQEHVNNSIGGEFDKHSVISEM